MNYGDYPIVPLELVGNYGFQPPSLGQETIISPNSHRSRGLWKLGLPLVAFFATFATACDGGGETVDDVPSSESAPALTTTSSPTTESVPITELTPTTEMETTTSVDVTETTEAQVNINNKALCEQARDPRILSPDNPFAQAGVPNLDELEFYGGCTGLPDDLIYFWGWPGGPGYDVDLDTNGFEYNSQGYHYSELPIGTATIPWDNEHPKYQQYEPLTLRELAELEPGTPLCWYFGTEKEYAENLIFGRIALATFYNKYTRAEPETFVAIFFQNPDGTEDPYDGRADGMGVMPDAKTGAWRPTWMKLGKCVDLQVAV